MLPRCRKCLLPSVAFVRSTATTPPHFFCRECSDILIIDGLTPRDPTEAETRAILAEMGRAIEAVKAVGGSAS